VAKDKALLRKLRITHVLNTAMGDALGRVKTNEHFYKSTGIKFYGIDVNDSDNEKINEYFAETSDFIDKALSSGGKVCLV